MLEKAQRGLKQDNHADCEDSNNNVGLNGVDVVGKLCSLDAEAKASGDEREDDELKRSVDARHDWELDSRW